MTDSDRDDQMPDAMLGSSSAPGVANDPHSLPDPVLAHGAPPVAFDAFFTSHREAIGRSLSLTLGDDQLGFEAADEGMVRAYERWSTVAALDNPQGWVYRTGLNWARSWLRKRKRGRPKDELLSPSEATHDRPTDFDLERAMLRLTDDQRAVVVLRFYLDWSVEQTATALDIAPGTVKSRLSRAMDSLQNDLTPKNESTN